MSETAATQRYYCGPAPVPDDLLSAWNADAVALALCLCILALHLLSGDDRHRGALLSALGLLGLLFLSPLCALTVALFSARAAHHALLVAAVAPLLALALAPALERLPRLSPAMLAVAQAIALWVWHVPAIYAVAIAGAPAYWAMQASLLATGILFWRAVLDPATGAGAGVMALLATVIQMGMLGALLTFAGEALYEPHRATTLAFGLTPLADQQLGGLIMWVPAALPYIAAALWKLSALLEPAARR